VPPLDDMLKKALGTDIVAHLGFDDGKTVSKAFPVRPIRTVSMSDGHSQSILRSRFLFKLLLITKVPGCSREPWAQELGRPSVATRPILLSLDS